MSTSSLKAARVEFRVTAEQKQTIETAAALEGRTLTDFSAEALIERANEVIQRERQVRVDAERFDAFARIMDQPAQSIDGLRDLMTRRPVFVD
ncbi:DUF1778 domain-containing protein [Microbacterium sp. UFMG61]|jgi:uncharacterized protein (DUF1778 family)|uniref:type II toxin-antitoxin system TacA family antitoxin n=1 Tax=Microbacterium sp. UFMG61 TaxID=2745935 RepID=UPI001890A2B9|nr:DUF1778 domain-containing protein [Microbacterium sp. UFMG61]